MRELEHIFIANRQYIGRLEALSYSHSPDFGQRCQTHTRQLRVKRKTNEREDGMMTVYIMLLLMYNLHIRSGFQDINIMYNE